MVIVAASFLAIMFLEIVVFHVHSHVIARHQPGGDAAAARNEQ
jgi:diadenosine tetraphosphate (Ap4A) HIT family hydrolase